MSLEDRFASARSLIEEHNSHLKPDSKGIVQAEHFIENIKVCGGTSEERLKNFSWEEILECLPNVQPKPTILAKELAKIFRGKEESKPQPVSTRPISSRRVETMTVAELVQSFDPSDYDSPVAKKLQSLSRGQPFVVFSSGRTVDVLQTMQLLQEIKDGYSAREDVITKDGDIRKVYKVGDLPDNFAEENPIFVGQPLRPDGTCDVLNVSWKGIDKKVRQLVRIVVDMKLVEVMGSSDGRERAFNLFDLATADSAFLKLSQRYTKAAVEFNQRENSGNLPKLQVSLNPGQGPKPVLGQGKKVNL